MIKKGIPASRGYALGYVYLKEDIELLVERGFTQDSRAERMKLREAVEEARKQLLQLREKTSREVGEADACIFDAHIMFLDDPAFTGAVEAEIEATRVNAMWALSEITKRHIRTFTAMEDSTMKERIEDLRDVSQRVLRILSGFAEAQDITEENTVVVANDLTPSDTATLDKNKVIAFVTNIGSRTSHTAIMARTLGIPAVVGLGDITSDLRNGELVIVDGFRGEIIIDPDADTIEDYNNRKAAYLNEQEDLLALRDVETRSRDGKRIEVSANIGWPHDVDNALANGAEGIGLYRTEFLYMDRTDLPTEDEQLEAYKYVLERMGDKPVIIRTLDIGGDKRLPYMDMPRELNPFLGYRAIRLSLDQPDIFKAQLRALLRASIYGNLRVMFPLISNIEEYREAMEIVEICQDELREEGIEFRDDIQWGIMIEVPAAAVIADELATEVDFLSIGTNDLIQYTLAVDRMSEKVSYLYDTMHPAVIRLIQMTIDGAHSQGKWVGMCGEMAGDEDAIPLLMSMGLDEFSMHATTILNAKRIIMENDAD